MDFRVPPLQKLASLRIAKLFWKDSFNSEELQFCEIINDIERKWEIRLTNFRDHAICSLNNFIDVNKLPSRIKTIVTESIFLLHQAYHRLLLWKLTYDPANQINLLEKGELYAPDYFTVEGEFNDVAWTKRFLLDKNYEVIHRFNLACCFWFENECATLWTEIKILHNPLINSLDFFGRFNHNIGLVALVVYTLEYQLPNPEYWLDISFWQMAFNFASEKGYEHAVYYIWQYMSEAEKLALVQKIFISISRSIDYPNNRMNYFLYSELSQQNKEGLFEWTITNDRSEIWLSLLLTLYATTEYSEVFNIVCNLPINMFSNLLQSLSHRIKQLKFPLEVELFQELWQSLYPEDKLSILEGSYIMIENLVKAKSFHILNYIIKYLSLEQKQNFLLKREYGINILDILCKEGQFDTMHKYLSFFLFDVDSYTQIQTLRKDSSLFLRTFCESSEFITWCKNKISKAVEIEVKNRITALQTSSTLLYELREKVCEHVSISPNTPGVSIFETHFAENDATLSS